MLQAGSVMWRLGIALYCKAGGVPWKLAEHDPETAFVGLSYAMRFGATQDVTFVTCCSQVFDSDGATRGSVDSPVGIILVALDAARPATIRVLAGADRVLAAHRYAGRTIHHG